MMTTPDRRALSERTAAPTHALTGVSVLPLELMASILGYLTPGELSTAASVSRGFRAAARLAGLCLRYRLLWRLGNPSSLQLDLLLELASHTQRRGWLVSFDWTCYLSRSVQGDTDVHVLQETEDQVSAVIASIIALMPYLVHLNIELPSGYGRELDELLLAQAPHLCTFELRRHGQGRRTRSIPALLFAASAPVLHSVALHSMVLPDKAIPAFARVRRLRIAYEDLFPPTNLARCFPLLRSLHLHYVLPSAPISPDSARRTLSGLRLDKLTVGESWQREMRMIYNLLPLRDIPLVRQHGFAYDLGESLWQTQTGPLDVRARASARGVAACEGPIEVLVVPDHDGAWRRVFLLGTWDDIERGVLCAWPPFPTHMVYLRLDGQFLADFLRARATYSGLRRIHIDLRSGAGHSVLPSRGGGTGTDRRLLCPALEEVVICALDTPRKVDARPQPALSPFRPFLDGANSFLSPLASLNSGRQGLAAGCVDVPRLGRALGQDERPDDARARLIVIGIDSAEPFDISLLDSSFQSIEMCAFSGPGSSVDPDAGLWDL